MDTIVSRFGLLLYFVTGLSVGALAFILVETLDRAQSYIPAPAVCGTTVSACI
jgi:hypothetical protein